MSRKNRLNLITGKKKKTFWLMVPVCFFLFGYWLKCQLNLNVLNEYSLSQKFPFTFLQREKIIVEPRPGVVISDSFDSFHVFPKWSPLWQMEKGTVELGYELNTLNGTEALVIKSESRQGWVYYYDKYIGVTKGDVFSFKGMVHVQGKNLVGIIGLSTFNGKREALKWNFVRGKTKETNMWTAISEKAVIFDDNVKYIRFKVSGKGRGTFRFDDVFLIKERGAPSSKIL